MYKNNSHLFISSLLLLSSPYAVAYSQLPCPNGTECSGQASHVTEIRAGTLNLKNLELFADTVSWPGVVRLEGNGSQGIYADNVTIHAGNGLATRGFYLVTSTSNATLETKLNQVNVTMASNAYNTNNVIGLLHEPSTTNHLHNVTIKDSTFDITSLNKDAYGFYIYSTGGGARIDLALDNVDVKATATTANRNARAIYLSGQEVSLTESSQGSITATVTSGLAVGIDSASLGTTVIDVYSTITANATSGVATGIRSGTDGSNHITTHTGEIKALSGTGTGIGIYAFGFGNHTIRNAADITVTGTNTGSAGIKVNAPAASNGYVDVISTGQIQTSQYGIDARSGNGAISIVNQGNISSTGGIGISAIAQNSGAVTIGNAATIETQAVNADAIFAQTSHGAIDITNTGTLRTSGDYARGIYAATSSATGVIDIVNSGAVQTYGMGSHGIYTSSQGSDQVTVSNHGSIDIHASSAARGIDVVSTGDNSVVTINNSGSIIHDAPMSGNYGIEANVQGNYAHVTINHNGTVQGGSFGIVAWDSFVANQVGSTSEINVGPAALVEATYAITVDMSEQNTINISHGGHVNGRNDGAALLLRSDAGEAPRDIINNAGLVSADNDQAVRAVSLSPLSSIELNNLATGQIDGVITVSDAQITFDNEGTWNLQDRAQEAANGTAEVALGTHAANVINNTGVINFLNTQTEITGLSAFHMDGGVLDLTQNAGARTQVRIGTDLAGSVFTANGGLMRMDVALGDSNSATDRLYINQAVTGPLGPTRIAIVNNGGLGDYTRDDGIQIVHVQDVSSTDAFTLHAPVTAGAFEYVLGRGTGANAQHWYLQSFERITPPDPNDHEAGKEWLLNPNAGAFQGNQYAAATMFNHNILDRRDNTRKPDQTLWVRMNHSDASTDLLRGLQHANISSEVLQVGADLFEKNDMVAGVYGGYGNSRIDNHSRQTGSEADGKVEGYQIGAYLSWLPSQGKGFYADVWVHYAWYNNQLSGPAQSHTTKYDSHGYALSAEAGYGFELNRKEDGRAWILEPHVQVIYNHLKTESFHDSSSTWYSNSTDNGWQSRVGARLYGQLAEQDKGVVPFVEFNWLHNSFGNRVSLNGVALESDIGKNIGEVKIGIQGEVSDNLSIWGHLGAQRGSESFKRYELQLGLGWQW